MQPLYEYVRHLKGHRNSKGELAEWVIKSHETGEILSSHKSEKKAKEHLQQMHIFNEAAEGGQHEDFHTLINRCATATASLINKFLEKYELSIKVVDTEEGKDFFEETGGIAVRLASLQDDVHVAPVAINEELISRYYYDEWDEDNTILNECVSDTLWHEACHHICLYISDTLDVDIMDNDSEEDIVENYALYMTSKTMGIHKEFSADLVDKFSGAFAILDAMNNGAFDKESLKEMMKFLYPSVDRENDLVDILEDIGLTESDSKSSVCAHCGWDGDGNLTEYNGRLLCPYCLKEFQRLDANRDANGYIKYHNITKRSDNLVGEASEGKKGIPVIVCADMGMGKTTFVKKINDSGKYKCYDLEVCDLPNIWGEPDEDGNMALVDGWEDIALKKIKSLDADVVAITSDPKMVNKLIESGIPFFLAYKDDIGAIRKDIEKRTSEHFANVVKDFWKYIEKSDIPEDLKEQMKECDPKAMTNIKCADALPPSIIETDKFQSDDRYRHWHDMFKLKTGGKAVSIMDRNIENLESRLKEFGKITSNLCTKLRLNAGEYLSSPSILHKILDRVEEKGKKSDKLLGESTYGNTMDKRIEIFMESVGQLGLTKNQMEAVGEITKVCLESVESAPNSEDETYYAFCKIYGKDADDIDRMVENGDIEAAIEKYGYKLNLTKGGFATTQVPTFEDDSGNDIGFIVGTHNGMTLIHNRADIGTYDGMYMLYREMTPKEKLFVVDAEPNEENNLEF